METGAGAGWPTPAFCPTTGAQLLLKGSTTKAEKRRNQLTMKHYWWQGGEPPERCRYEDIDLPNDEAARAITKSLSADWEQDVRCWAGERRPFNETPLFTAIWDGHEAQIQR